MLIWHFKTIRLDINWWTLRGILSVFQQEIRVSSFLEDLKIEFFFLFRLLSTKSMVKICP